MVKILRALAICGILLCSFSPIGVSAVANDAIRYEYWSIYNASPYGMASNAAVGAQQFTVGTMAHNTTQFKAVMARVGNPGQVNVNIYEVDGGGEPTGSPLCSGSLDANLFSVSPAKHIFSVDTASLSSATQYIATLSSPAADGSNYVELYIDHASTFVGGDFIYSADSGATWTDAGASVTLAFEVWGEPSISIMSAMVYQNYIQNGDMLFLTNYINTCPPYYTTGSLSPGNYFNIRLLQSDGVTPIAATTMKQWGDKPGAIYLSAAQAAAITPGDGLYLQMYGIYTGNPNVKHQLTSDEWSGDLSGWVLATANNMSAYYSTTTSLVSFVTFTSDQYVLNNEGGAIFQKGVPSLMGTHPELFNIKNKVPVFVPPPAKTTVGVPQTWQNIWGVSISAIFTDVGTMVGISGKDAGAALVFVLWIALVISVATKGGTPLIAMAIGIPIIFLGVWAALVDFVIVAAVIIVLALIGLIGFWITRT